MKEIIYQYTPDYIRWGRLLISDKYTPILRDNINNLFQEDKYDQDRLDLLERHLSSFDEAKFEIFPSQDYPNETFYCYLTNVGSLLACIMHTEEAIEKFLEGRECHYFVESISQQIIKNNFYGSYSDGIEQWIKRMFPKLKVPTIKSKVIK